MSIFQAVLLGVVQGVTEFLPISSSGHLVLMQNLLGLSQPNLAFDIFLHLATLLAIIIFFSNKLIKLKFKNLLNIFIATLPIIFIGLFLKDFIESLFSSVLLVSVALIITGIFNLISDKLLINKNINKKLNYKNSLLIGLFQALAITPGISRSGATLLGGLSQKLSRQNAFNFAFYLAIPAILGASVLQIFDLINQNNFDQINILIFLVGGTAALISGLLSLKLFKIIINTAKLEIFGLYCLLIGGVSLVISLLN